VASGRSDQSGAFRGFSGRGTCRELGPSGALFNEIAICRGPETNADPEQRVEGAACVSPSVPAKLEFVEIALQMALPEAVEHAFRRSLQVGKHAMNPVVYLVRLASADDLRLMRV